MRNRQNESLPAIGGLAVPPVIVFTIPQFFSSRPLTIPLHYSIGIIVDPCNGTTFDCCNGYYGDPEYRAVTGSSVAVVGLPEAISNVVNEYGMPIVTANVYVSILLLVHFAAL